jgi:uncharacterized membrane protein YfcA
MEYFFLLLLGCLVGAMGTLVGVGGGFILVPVLLLLYPQENPTFITSVSLVVIFFNSLSGSVAYGLMKRIDYKTGLLFAAATLPGSILGPLTVEYIPRKIFNLIFGFLVILVSIFLFNRKKEVKQEFKKKSGGSVTRELTDIEGNNYIYRFYPIKGIIISLFVGYFSSVLGVGGGIIYVPFMITLLNFPVQIATCTSQFILGFMALISSIVHFASGNLNHGLLFIASLSAGAVLGAQLGAQISSKIQGNLIIKCLAVALGLAGIRILFLAFK